MKNSINILKEARSKTEKSFIEKSIIAETSLCQKSDDPLPDLKIIIDLNIAISILENEGMHNPKIKVSEIL